MRHWNSHWVIEICLAFLLVLSVSSLKAGINEAIAKDFFVAVTNGNDKYPGTQEKPFLTLEQGASILSPGDTLYVRGGTYQRTHYMWEPPSGISWKIPTTIMAYQKEKVVVKPLSGYSVFEFREKSQYIIMDGFIMDATGGHDGIRMGTGGHHIRIANSEIKNAPHQGLLTSNGTFHELLKLSIHHNGLTSNTPGQSHGIYMSGSNNLIENCDIFENGSWGVHIYSTNYKPSYNIVRSNRVFNNNRTNAGGPGIGVHVGTNNLVYNNLVWGNRDGIMVDLGSSNSKIYNNTVYSNDRYGIWVGPRGKDSLVKNNIIYNSNTSFGLLISNGSGNSIISNNLIIAKNPISSLDPNAILTGNLLGKGYDPKFQDPVNHDFRLTPGSSAIGSGLVIDEVKTDFDGVSRNMGGPFDIGSYAFGASLAPPTNLVIISEK